MSKMKSTIGAAVNVMETHIKSGTVWCPTTMEDEQKTQKFSNFDKSKKKSQTSRTISSNDSAACKLISSGEKHDCVITDIDDLQENISFKNESNISLEQLLETNGLILTLMIARTMHL
jgi:uncharacterized Rossmann fold enzyme